MSLQASLVFLDNPARLHACSGLRETRPTRSVDTEGAAIVCFRALPGDPRLTVLRDSVRDETVRDETVPLRARPGRPCWAPPAGRGAQVIQSRGAVLETTSAGSAPFGQTGYHTRAHFL